MDPLLLLKKLLQRVIKTCWKAKVVICSEQPHLRQGEVLPITVGVVCLNVSSVKLQKVLVTDPYVKAQNVSIEKGYQAIQHVLFF